MRLYVRSCPARRRDLLIVVILGVLLLQLGLVRYYYSQSASTSSRSTGETTGSPGWPSHTDSPIGLPPSIRRSNPNSESSTLAPRDPNPESTTSTRPPDARSQMDRWLWPDSTTTDGPFSFQHAEELGIWQQHTLPYPPDLPNDNVSIPELIFEPIEFFDPNLFITRPELQHHPIVSHVGLENFFDLRFTALTRSSVTVGLEERRALLHARQNGQMNASLNDVLALDHQWHAHYATFDYQHEQPNAYSNRTGSAPRNSIPPASELLTRMIQGDGVYDPLGQQVMDADFPFERGMITTFRNHFCDRFVELMHVPHRPPLVVNIQKGYLFQFTVRCLYFRPNALTTAKRKFVLLGTEIDETPSLTFFESVGMSLNPKDFPNVTLRYLLNHPLLAHFYCTDGTIRHPKFTALPIGLQFYHRVGGFQPLSTDVKIQVQNGHQLYTNVFLLNIRFDRMFPHLAKEKTKSMKWGMKSTMWLERALEVLVGSTVKPPVKIIPLDQLPERITTFYVVLMPIERHKRADRPSLTDDVIIFEEPSEANHHRTASVQHIALLPFTVALYHKLRQEPHGSPDRDVKTVSSFTLWEWRYSWYYYLEAHKDISVPAGYGLIGYYRSLSSNAFVTSPSGKGYECFRTWESIALGAIPLLGDPIAYGGGLFPDEVRYQPEVHVAAAVEPYRDLPVIFLSELESITAANMTLWQKVIYEKASKGEYKLEKLFMQYWVDKIYGHTNED